ncbi:MAG: trypsin-like peptidase domain-containing protein, partial [Streptococcus mitis]|nr:trypsin-like peptidase domain-containing protein [Streptococcus mitis]
MKHLKTFYKKWFQLLVVIVISFFSGALGGFSIAQLTQKSSVSNSNNNSTITQTAYKNENSTTQAVNKVKDAVVSVITYSANRQNSVFGNDETDTDSQQISSEGSGVIYKKNDKEAYIVTNNHVINGASKVDIRLSDGTKVPGEIVGADTFSDIAVIKISSEKVTTVAEFGDSSKLTVGETAIAIGSPLGSEYA